MGPLDDPVDEAKRIIEAAEASKVTLRLLGGVAFRLRCPSSASGSLQRKYVDIDVIGHSKQSRAIQKFFPELGYLPRDRFNALHGEKRLVFNDLDHQRRVDVFLDVFEMCHKFNFKDRIEVDRYTIPLSDLLATKLQIVEMNSKDLRDLTCLLVDHPIGDSDGPDTVNGKAISKLCGEDWGIYRTFTMNLDRLADSAGKDSLSEEQKSAVVERAQALKARIEEAPKSMRWKMRARMGDKVRWYELPEADKEVVDSRITGEVQPQ